MITIGLPVWNSKKIAWLPMESFCRQKTSVPWELIVYEEKHPEACGYDFFNSYMDRLRHAGCVNFVYLTHDKHQPLSFKWAKIGRYASASSKMFCICGADNYYQPYMLQDTWEAYKSGYDWLNAKEGYFYNFETKKVAMFSLKEKPAGKTGLQMSAATHLMREIPPIEKHRLLDSWLFNVVRPKRPVDSKKHLTTLCTHGYNNISTKRGKMIQQYQVPFYRTDKTIEELVPKEIVNRIKKL